MANVEVDIFVDHSLLTIYFMSTIVLHKSWHLIGQTTLGQRTKHTLAQRNLTNMSCPTLAQRYPNALARRWPYDGPMGKLMLGQGIY